MPNMSPKKAPMPTQEPNVRNKNFLEGSYRLHRGSCNRRGTALP